MKKRNFNPKPAKEDREELLLMGLIELYLRSGKPVASNALRDAGFESLSSATIRNYFAKLEDAGYLIQQHSSGGRIPTALAYKLYVSKIDLNALLGNETKTFLHQRLHSETREIARYLQKAAETLSELTNCCVFISSPRFDQDYVIDVKLILVDATRFLAVFITEFGLIHTETLHTKKKLGLSQLKGFESYFRFRMTGMEKPKLSLEDEKLASGFYNEAMLRHLVHHTHFSTEDIYKTGFSKLFNAADFHDATSLAGGLSLLENSTYLRSLLRECMKENKLKVWVGDDLASPELSACSVLSIPYKINGAPIGAIGILGPIRLPYKDLFTLLIEASVAISDTLTRSLYKFKISYREPKQNRALEAESLILLEDKGRSS